MTERLDTLQNFFLNEISNIKAEIKNNCKQKTSRDTSTANNEKVEFVQNQIIYLREEERNSKIQLRNLILDNVVKSDISKDTSYTKRNTLLTPNYNYQFPKRLSKNHRQKSRFNALFVDENSQNNNEDLHVTESSGKTLYSEGSQKLTETDLLIRNSARKNSQ